MIPWRIEREGRIVDCGLVGGTEKDVMTKVLSRELGQDAMIESKALYRVKVGNSIASVYGDEFERTANASAIDESKLEKSGHLFDSPEFTYPGLELLREAARTMTRTILNEVAFSRITLSSIGMGRYTGACYCFGCVSVSPILFQCKPSINSTMRWRCNVCKAEVNFDVVGVIDLPNGIVTDVIGRYS